ncbi:MAG: response regulator transcription factor, partial [Nitrospinae bacterium]|nr:response regulator transcription factor [Nitrospinota bacterium]
MKKSGKKILVVEDEAHLAKGLKFNLEREGYQVTLVDNGQSAVEILGEEDFDLMILDIMLPKLSGIEVARRIRNT